MTVGAVSRPGIQEMVTESTTANCPLVLLQFVNNSLGIAAGFIDAFLVGSEPIPAPLPDIAAHLMQAKGIGRLLSNR